MNIPLRALLLSVILGIAASAQGQVNIVNFDFGAVRISCGSGYAYEWPGAPGCRGPYQFPMQDFNSAPGFGWIFSLSPGIETGGAGLTGPNTAFSPPSFEGMPFNQAVFLQNRGTFVWQQIAGFTAGNYILSFYLGSRCGFSGQQTVQASIDGRVIGAWQLADCTPFALETANFSVGTNGSHTLEFTGMNFGDHTAFLSYVTITRAGT